MPVRPSPRPLRLCATVAVFATGLTGCAAIENDRTEQPEATTKSSVAAPRTDATTTPNPVPATDAKPSVGDVSLASDDRGDLGAILVDGTGRTVYAFSRDPDGQPTCYDACAATWLPVLATGDPAGGIGIDVAAARTVARRDGGQQVTYRGHPLYHYAGDATDRDANGQGLDLFGGEWHVLTKDGQVLG